MSHSQWQRTVSCFNEPVEKSHLNKKQITKVGLKDKSLHNRSGEITLSGEIIMVGIERTLQEYYSQFVQPITFYIHIYCHSYLF